MEEKIKDKNIGIFPEPVSLKATEKILDQMNKSICTIYNNDRKGSGFFTKIPYKKQLLPVLIVNDIVINKDDILNNSIISLNINSDKSLKKIKLDNNRKIYTNENNNITIIEIKENKDKLNNKYLELDDKIINYFNINKKEELNYLNDIYSNESIYLLNNHKDNDIAVSYGKLSYLYKKKLYYQCNIKEGLSGSPILLTNSQKLIGMHNVVSKKYNKGSLLIYLIKEFSKIKNNLLLIGNDGYKINNYIIGEFDIKEDNQNIRIINSYEQSNRESSFIEYFKYEKSYENEKEIKENCEIRINDELIPFSYFHKFNKKGKYKIKYTFILNIRKINYIFYECSSLTNINLSNFNTNNVTNMSCMFLGCSSLKDINISKFNTNNVTNMSCMFFGCSSLIELNLSNFNTDKVIDMSCMFSECSSLININLSNFNTDKVIDMSHMFKLCLSLKNINLSKFITNNVTNMEGMFSGCSSLTNLDLSNFNTNYVKNMMSMFDGCSSLINIDLSNFNTSNVRYKDMSYMFYGCKKLNKHNIITNDKNILKNYNKYILNE